MNADESVWLDRDATTSGGVFTMTRCPCATLEGIGDGSGLVGAKVMIGGSDGQGNLFKSAGIGCTLNDFGDAQIVVSHNRFQVGDALGDALYSAGVTAFAYSFGAAAAPSHYLISDNSFQVAPPADGVDLWDFNVASGASKLIEAVVSGNRIVLSGSLTLPDLVNAAGIGEYYAQDVRVLDNCISGTGLAGIYLGTDLTGDDAAGAVSGWQIIGNDVSHVNASVAPIWLGPGTSDCTVIGGALKTTVLNQGTGNTLINVDPLSAPIAALSMRANASMNLKPGLMQRLHSSARP